MSRTYIDSALTLWCSPSGGGDGSSSSSPMLLQDAIWKVANTFIINDALVKIQLLPNDADHPYPPAGLVAWVGSCNVGPGAGFTVPTIRGDPSNPGSYIIGGTSSPVSNAVCGVTCHTPWFIDGVQLQTGSSTSGIGLEADFGTKIYAGNIVFAECGTQMLAQWAGSAIEILMGSNHVLCESSQRYAYGTRGGMILAQGDNTITLATGVAYSVAFAVQNTTGIVDLSGATFSGGSGATFTSWSADLFEPDGVTPQLIIDASALPGVAP